MTPYAAAMTFLANVGEPAKSRLSAVQRIGRILEDNTYIVEFGTHIGSGFFGDTFECSVAIPLLYHFTFKLTSDSQEAQASANLTRVELPNVVHFYDVFRLRGVTVHNQLLNRRMPVYGIVLERVSAGLLSREAECVLNEEVRKAKDKFMVWPHQIVKDTEGAWERVEESMADLIRTLAKSRHTELREVSVALARLLQHGIYTVDMHRGNVGTDPETGHVKIFDLGLSRSPRISIDVRRNPAYNDTEAWDYGAVVSPVFADEEAVIQEIG